MYMPKKSSLFELNSKTMKKQIHFLVKPADSENDQNYEINSKYKMLLQHIAYLSNGVYYVCDYERNIIIYPLPLFRLGSHEILFMDSASLFYTQIVSPDDRKWLMEVGEASLDFFYSLTDVQKTSCRLVCDFYIKDCKGQFFLAHHQLTPLELNSNGTLRSVVCSLHIPCNKTVGNVYIRLDEENKIMEYNRQKQLFTEIHHQSLSLIKRKVLELSAQGYTETEIAAQMNISINTLKTHKKEILVRLNVPNITSAIQWFNINANK